MIYFYQYPQQVFSTPLIQIKGGSGVITITDNLQATSIGEALARIPEGGKLLWELPETWDCPPKLFKLAVREMFNLHGYEESVYPVIKSFVQWACGESGWTVGDVVQALEHLEARGVDIPFKRLG